MKLFPPARSAFFLRRQIFPRLRFVPGALFLLLSALGLLGAAADSGGTYRNPILPPDTGADPAVFRFGEKFYLYSTNAENVVYVSEDLVNWKKGPAILPEKFKGAWAPEVYHHEPDGKYYLYYTLKYKIGVAVADSPEGPFEDLGFLAIPGIDAHLFKDDDGKLYLYFTHTPAFTMYCLPMRTPTEPGGPVTKCFEVSADWERKGHAINEGPWMFKKDGTYYLFYSGGDGQTEFYSIGYAGAPGPLGPFKKFEGNPVIKGNDKIFGPGHGSFIADRKGQWWHVYHQKTGTEKGWKRILCLDPLRIDEQTGEMSSLPTKGDSQTAPAMDKDLVWPPEITPRGAYFYRRQNITLSCATPGAVIRYTLDGSPPTTDSPVYQGPFEIDRSVVLTARAYKEGMKASEAGTMRFFRTNWEYPAPVLTEFPSGDPPFRVYSSPNPVAPPKMPFPTPSPVPAENSAAP